MTHPRLNTYETITAPDIGNFGITPAAEASPRANIYNTKDVHVTMSVTADFYLDWDNLNFRDSDVAAWDFAEDKWGDYSSSDYFWVDKNYNTYFDPEDTTQDRKVRITVEGYDFDYDQVATSVKVYLDLIGTASKPDYYKGWNGTDIMIGSKRNEIFDGLRGNDKIYAGSGNDKVYGEAGNDSLYGQNGHDRLDGYTGNDYLSGGSGNDILKGGSGNDKLTGGNDADTLAGGSGADSFVFRHKSDSSVAAAGRDYIADFSTKEGDTIYLRGIDANSHKGGNQAFEFIGRHVFTHSEGELRYIKGSDHITVLADINGDGDADLSIRLHGTSVLHEGDFVL